MVKFGSLALAAALTAGCLVGCGGTADAPANTPADTSKEENNAADNTDDNTADAVKELSGKISLAGSTSMEKVCEGLMEGFMETYQDVTVTTEYTGSGAGLESLTAGSVDIGNASRHVKEEELANGLVENVIALDGIAVITDTANTVGDLSVEDLAQIYTGEITNWSELGGADGAIVVIGRESGSGTRDAFEELVEVKDECAYAQELDSTGAVLAKVAATEGAIGYVSLDVVDDTAPLTYNGGHCGKIRLRQHKLCHLTCRLCAAGHCHAAVRLLHCQHIVDTVTGHCHRVSPLFHSQNQLFLHLGRHSAKYGIIFRSLINFLLRCECAGIHKTLCAGDTCPPCHFRCGHRAVAGNYLDRDTLLCKILESPGCFFPDAVAQQHQCHRGHTGRCFATFRKLPFIPHHQ